MAILTISIDYDGEDSTDTQEELATALEGIARRLRDYDWIMGDQNIVRDYNGNKIGYWDTQPSGDTLLYEGDED